MHMAQGIYTCCVLSGFKEYSITWGGELLMSAFKCHFGLFPKEINTKITLRGVHKWLVITYSCMTMSPKMTIKRMIFTIEGILPKGPYPPCLRMADRALLAGYPRHIETASHSLCLSCDDDVTMACTMHDGAFQLLHRHVKNNN